MSNALIVVDMQNLFVDAIPDGTAVLAAVNEHVARAVANGEPVFYTRDYAPTDFPEGDPENITALHADLHVAGTVVDKGAGKNGGMSGFVLDDGRFPGGGGLNDLAGLLRSAGATEVTVVGIATDVCVAATARDAVRLGYPATIPVHATGFVHAHPDGDDAALAELRAAGITVR